MNSHKIIRPLLSILLIAFLNIFCFAQNTVLDENTRDSKSEKIVETKQLGRSKQTNNKTIQDTKKNKKITYKRQNQNIVSKTHKSINHSKNCLSRQCNGRTKNGSRCRNITKNCNGYCWRHNR